MDRTHRLLVGPVTALVALMALPAVVALALLVGVLYHVYVAATALRFLGRGMKSLARRLAAWRPAAEVPEMPVTLALPRRR